MKKPVDWDDLYPGRFVKAGELGAGSPMVTIADVELEDLEGDDGVKTRGVVAFRETPKKLVLNKTNGICLREMFGRTLADWVGKRVLLYAATWNGEPAIRIWGSPDIEADRVVEIKLPRRKASRMTLHKEARK